MTPDERAARLKEIEADEEAEAKKLQAEAEDRKIARSDLKKKLELEHGAEGVDFAIVSLGAKLFAVKAPEFVVYKKYIAVKDTMPEHVQQFARACIIFPSQAEFDRVVMEERKFVLANKCEGAVFALMAGRDADFQAK